MITRTLASLDYDALATEARAGGFTVALDGSRPTQGYAVAIGDPYSRTVPADAFGGDSIYRYVIDYGHALRDDGAHLGAWRAPSGDVVLDVVQVMRDRGNALALARATGQAALYDLGAGALVAA